MKTNDLRLSSRSFLRETSKCLTVVGKLLGKSTWRTLIGLNEWTDGVY